jgi:hypothetical protein
MRHAAGNLLSIMVADHGLRFYGYFGSVGGQIP